MIRQIDSFYLSKDEPLSSCLLFLRAFILEYDKNITEAWKYNMPFFCYKSKMFCYLWVHKKTHNPYIGFVEGKFLEHPLLMSEKRARMKIIQFDAQQDIPVNTIKEIMEMALYLYRK